MRETDFSVWEAQQRFGWQYRSKISKEFVVTQDQLDRAIEDGLIQSEQMQNPFNPKGVSVMVGIEDVKENLGKSRHSQDTKKREQRSR